MTDAITRLTAALADRYRIERELGQGGMATVYLAADLKHDRKVALKVLKPELAAVLGAERFVVEIKTTAALQHPHILPLFDSGVADSFLYYVMPFIDGETLRDKLNRETQLGVDEAVRIASDIAEALAYAHEHGVIHRDIKPENILLANGRPMVADFGIALAVSAAAGGRMTETGLSLGTPHYMSPEQATAEKEITGRSDIYSLASVLYEMLTGEPPHMGNSAQQIIMKIITETPQPVTELRRSVPPNVAGAVAKALEKLPADRFESAKAFADALHDKAFVGSTSYGLAGGAGSARGTNRAAMVVAAAVVLAAGAVLGFALKRTPAAPERVVRFRVAAPTGTEFSTSENNSALSPDGQWMALVAAENRSRTTQIYLRRVDRLETTPVAGTEGATAPFFSPDGRTLGFVSPDRRLRRVDVAGGPVTTIADRPADRRFAPAWTDDGQVYFSSDFHLYRVSAGGGVSQPIGDSALTVRDRSGGVLPALYAFPTPLPGRGRILVSKCAEGILRGSFSCSGELMMMEVTSGRVTPLDVPAERGWYVDGHLVILSATGTLSAVEFDAASGEVRGEPVALLDGVGGVNLRRPQISISISGSLLYLDGQTSADQIVVEVDRRGTERVVIAKPGPYRWVRLAPDERRIVLVELGQSEGSQLFIHDERSGATSPLTFAGSNQRPSWSPDGRRIAFSSSRGSQTDIWVVPADGSAPEAPVALGKDVVQHTATSWTPDGKWIIIDGLADDGPNAGADDIYALSVSGDSALRTVVATPANEQVGEVSPDGRWIAYVSDDAGQPQVYVQPFLRPGGRSLVSLGAATEPAWASSNELIYSSISEDSLISARLTFGESVGVTRTALFGRGRYSMGSTSWRDYDVSRDGKKFIFTRSITASRSQEPIMVVDWIADVRAAIAAQRVAK